MRPSNVGLLGLRLAYTGWSPGPLGEPVLPECKQESSDPATPALSQGPCFC